MQCVVYVWQGTLEALQKFPALHITRGHGAGTLQHCLPNRAQGAVSVTGFAVRADKAVIGPRPGWEPCLCHAFYQICCILRSAILCCC